MLDFVYVSLDLICLGHVLVLNFAVRALCSRVSLSPENVKKLGLISSFLLIRRNIEQVIYINRNGPDQSEEMQCKLHLVLPSVDDLPLTFLALWPFHCQKPTLVLPLFYVISPPIQLVRLDPPTIQKEVKRKIKYTI